MINLKKINKFLKIKNKRQPSKITKEIVTLKRPGKLKPGSPGGGPSNPPSKGYYNKSW